jgi:hypothetical protein
MLEPDFFNGLLVDADTERDKAVFLIDSAISRGQDLEAIRSELNTVTADATEVVWYGTFEDLCTASGEFPCEVREIFFEQDHEGSIPPIPQEHREEFADFVRSFGA